MGPALLAPDDERMPLVWPEKAAGGGSQRQLIETAAGSCLTGRERASAPDVGSRRKKRERLRLLVSKAGYLSVHFMLPPAQIWNRNQA